MSIKLKHSGGNSVSLNPPTSAPTSSEVAFKLPTSDGSSGQVLMTDGSGNLSWVSLPTGGLSMVQQWAISTSGGEFTPGGGTDLNTGWYIQSQAGAGNIGSSMTQSSGVFTFPSTGIYSILFICAFYNNNGSGDRSHFAHIKTSTDGGSNYIISSYNGTNTSARGASTHANTYGQLIFDVTNTSTHKVKFHAESTHSGSRVYTSPGDRNYTNVIFQKLGET